MDHAAPSLQSRSQTTAPIKFEFPSSSREIIPHRAQLRLDYFQAWLLKGLLFGKVGLLPGELSEKEKLILLRRNGLIEALSCILFEASILYSVDSIRLARF